MHMKHAAYLDNTNSCPSTMVLFFSC